MGRTTRNSAAAAPVATLDEVNAANRAARRKRRLEKETKMHDGKESECLAHVENEPRAVAENKISSAVAEWADNALGVRVKFKGIADEQERIDVQQPAQLKQLQARIDAGAVHTVKDKVRTVVCEVIQKVATSAEQAAAEQAAA